MSGDPPLFVWPRAYGAPVCRGAYRQTPEAFVVEEILDFVPEGEGEHLWLWLEKRELNTVELARRLARGFEIAPRDVGFSGLKDRSAVTRQWLSLWLPGRATPDDLDARVASAGARLLKAARHPRKLKRGVHRGNRFGLHVAIDAAQRDAFAARWQALSAEGVPNYFGPQRFGRDGANVARARQLFARGWRKRDDKQGLLLSAARSWLFNAVLAARVSDGRWNRALEGDVFNLDGTMSRFAPEALDAALQERVARLDIHPTGALWGRGALESGAAVAALEQRVADEHAELAAGLEGAGLRQERRALRVRLAEARLEHDEAGVKLTFALGRGAFATAVLRELIEHPTL